MSDLCAGVDLYRKQTLHLLYKITLEFVKEASRKRGFAEKQLDQFGGKIFPYGSYRLGVYGPGMALFHDTLSGVRVADIGTFYRLGY